MRPRIYNDPLFLQTENQKKKILLILKRHFRFEGCEQKEVKIILSKKENKFEI
jgi:hypothetical protein